MYKYGYMSEQKERSVIFTPKNRTMHQNNQQEESVSEFEILQLRRRISDLEKQLQESEMKSIAWQTMVEIAEREFQISIKKSTTPNH
jgi:hypothetical protein